MLVKKDHIKEYKKAQRKMKINNLKCWFCFPVSKEETYYGQSLKTTFLLSEGKFDPWFGYRFCERRQFENYLENYGYNRDHLYGVYAEGLQHIMAHILPNVINRFPSVIVFMYLNLPWKGII